MMALLGPSGAGKSTLMDILAMRKTTGRLEGDVTVNGRPRSQAHFRLRSAYVPQEDVFLPTLTALETMQYYGALRLPAGTGRAERETAIQHVLGVMGLAQQAGTLVGGDLPGVSRRQGYLG